MENSFFLVTAILFTFLLFGGIAILTLRFKQNWGGSILKDRIQMIAYPAIPVIVVIYVTIRFYIIAFTAGGPQLQLMDFLMLILLSAATAGYRLFKMKKANSPHFRPAFLASGIVILSEIFSFVLWILHISITPELFMFTFYLLLTGLAAPFFFFKNEVKPIAVSKKEEE